ncbi:MAG: AAA family ATPase [Chitinivibrionales bacterium]|nr:AAA family ATPase [Chitinivibrionales bacterium]
MSRSIAVAGKGGTGKTTITALIVRYLLEKKEGPILVVDADPDANLGTMLGIKPEKSVGDLRDDLLKEIKNLPAGMGKAAYMEAGLHEVITESRGFDLLTMGRGEGPGCYCYMNSLIRKFADELNPSYAWVVMDNEAGLEHISRRTTNNIDYLLVAVTESPLSFNTAKNIEAITGAIKNSIGRKFVVASMVRPEKIDSVKERLAGLSFEYLGNVPRDEAVENAILAGNDLLTLPDSASYRSIREIMSHLGGYNAAT